MIEAQKPAVSRNQHPTADIHPLVADECPNFSICGILYHVSGEVRHPASRRSTASTSSVRRTACTRSTR